MDTELRIFLQGRPSDFAQTVEWAGGAHVLTLNGYLTTDAPPEAMVLAGRAVVVRGADVLVVLDPGGEHVLPGGRRQADESPTDSVHREVLEESGWTISSLEPLAVLHLHYETPRPEGVGRILYPDFIWQVFKAEPLEHIPERRVEDDWEQDAYFRPIEAMMGIVEPYQRSLLEAIVAGTGVG